MDVNPWHRAKLPERSLKATVKRQKNCKNKLFLGNCKGYNFFGGFETKFKIFPGINIKIIIIQMIKSFITIFVRI